MSLLVLLLPERGRTPAPEPVAANHPEAPADAGAVWHFVFSRDGLAVDREGSTSVSALPSAERVVLVAQDEDVSWWAVKLPKVAASRLREALSGAMEDLLLEDTTHAHLAVSRQGLREGDTTWVAALHKPWLQRELARLHAQGIQVDAVVGASEPSPQASAHARIGPDGQAIAVVCSPQGVALWPLGWSGWRTRMADLPPVAWSAEPAAAQALNDVGEAPSRLMSPAQRALQAAASGTNLLQFDLAPSLKGSRALISAWVAFKDRRLRALHVGLLGLLMVQVLGLNVQAWQARQELEQLQARSERVLREVFPTIRVVVDPLVQAERELQAMRRVTGLPGATDLETWIDVVSLVWAGQAEPLSLIRWDAQGLTLEAAQWPEPAVMMLRDHAQRQGWRAQLQGKVLKLERPAGGAL